jgi:hypothetical protein
LKPKVIFGLKGAFFTFLNRPPLLAGAQTAFSIEVNKLLSKVMLNVFICLYGISDIKVEEKDNIAL